MFTQDNLHGDTICYITIVISCSLMNKSIFSKNKQERFTLEREKKREEKKRKTCSLEATWTGPIFTDTYLPLDDNLCFTRPCNKYVKILDR